MRLSEYVSSGRGKQSELCSSIGAHAPDMSRWVSGDRPVPEERCPLIERATGGLVTCEELRDDIAWHRIKDKSWPWHPQGKPLVDVLPLEA